MIGAFRHWLGTLGAPLSHTSATAATPLAPIAREPVDDAYGVAQKAHAEARQAFVQRVVASNNACVYRDYGHGPVVEYLDDTVPRLTDVELGQVAALGHTDDVLQPEPDLILALDLPDGLVRFDQAVSLPE